MEEKILFLEATFVILSAVRNQKHEKKVWKLFKIKNEYTRTMSIVNC